MFDSFNIPNDPNKWRKLHPLTILQRSIIQALINGCSIEEAARQCHRSKATVEKMLQSLRHENGCGTTVQLVVKIITENRTQQAAA